MRTLWTLELAVHWLKYDMLLTLPIADRGYKMQLRRHVSSLRESNIQDVVTELQQLPCEDANDDCKLKRLSTLETLNDLMQLPGNARPCQSATAHRPLFSLQVRSQTHDASVKPGNHLHAINL